MRYSVVALALCTLASCQLRPTAARQVVRSSDDPDLVTVTITAPTSGSTYDAGASATLTTLAGTAASAPAITSCRWENNQGGLSGVATGGASWSVSSIVLTVGINTITVSCTNAIGLTSTDTLFVTRSAGDNPINAARLPSSDTTGPNDVWAAVGAPSINESRTLCYEDTGGLDTLATINSQISGCAADTYVLLQAGTYNFAGVLQLKSHVTLRGAGPNSTFLVFSSGIGCAPWPCVISMGGDPSHALSVADNTATWSAGYTKGTSTLVFSSKTNIQIGTVLHIDELSDPCTSAVDDPWPESWRSSIGPYCSLGSGEQNGGGMRNGRAHFQEVTVMSVEAGACAPNCDIGIRPALHSTFSSSRTPQALWPTDLCIGVGIEDLSVDVGGNADRTFGTANCTDGWIKHVRAINPGRSNVNFNTTTEFTVRDSYFFRTLDHSTTSYGLEFMGGCGILLENNIFQWISSPIVINGGCNSVIAYNFAINDEWTDNTSYMFQATFAHNAGTEHIVYEGNDWPGVNFDIQHGSQQLLTVFRNYLWGRERAPTAVNNTVPVSIRAVNRFMNFLGNVMGESGYHTAYQCDTVTCTAPENSIWHVGSGYGIPTGPDDDVRVVQSMFRWGNWDNVTSTADSTSGDQTGTRWCGNSSNTGWTTRCSSTSEVPSATGGTYQQSIPSAESLPASLYLSAKPSFMKSADPWPFYGPDVTHASPISGTGGHAARNPAGQCYFTVMGGTATGTTVLPFTCSYPLP